MTECVVCGFPRYRRGDHAEWCERVGRANQLANHVRTCSVDDCESDHHAKGLCLLHYRQARWQQLRDRRGSLEVR